MPTCSYCSQVFKNHSNLLKHQKTAKYCLEIQRKLSFCCKLCNLCIEEEKYKEHIAICKKENKQKIRDENTEMKKEISLLREQVKEYRKVIKRLECRLENIAVKMGKKPTFVNTILNVLPLSANVVKKNTRSFLYEHTKNSSGIADYCVKSLENRIVCKDPSRKNFKYKTEDGKIESDVGGMKIIILVFSSIRDMTNMYTHKTIQDSQLSVKDNPEELSNSMKRIEDAMTLRKEIFEGSCGKTNKTVRETLKQLAQNFYVKPKKIVGEVLDQDQEVQDQEVQDQEVQDQEAQDQEVLDQDQEVLDQDQEVLDQDQEVLDQDQEAQDQEVLDQDQERTLRKRTLSTWYTSQI